MDPISKVMMTLSLYYVVINFWAVYFSINFERIFRRSNMKHGDKILLRTKLFRINYKSIQRYSLLHFDKIY